MTYLNGKLNTTGEVLDLLHGDANDTDASLDSLTEEISQLERTIKQLRQEVYNAKNANIQGESSFCRRVICSRLFKIFFFFFSGAMDTISEAHRQSMMSELRANISTSNPGSTLEQSAATRQTTEEVLAGGQKDFDRKHEKNLKKLDKLSADLDQLDLSPLSEQVWWEWRHEISLASFLCHFHRRKQHCGPIQHWEI